MKKIYLLPNLITAFALSCGLFVIFKVNMLEPGSGYYHVMKTSALLLLLAAFADFFDGAIARIFKAESEFGFIFDSLADAVSFGVAPSVLLLKTLSLEQGTLLSFAALFGAMIYSLCGILRLVRFSVSTQKSHGDLIEMTAQKKNFTGLPVPAGAAAAISANLLFLSPRFQEYFTVSEEVKVGVLTFSMFLLGYLMVSRWKFPSLKALHLRVPSFQLVILTVAAAIIILYGLLHFFAFAFMFIAWGYVFLALILSVIRLIAGKKSKTLEDFEPDEND